MKNLFFIDFETTGLNPYHNETIEVGIQKFGMDEYYNTLIIPKNENGIYYKYVPPKVTEITGITDQDIIKKGILNNKELLWENEQAKHKLLDLVGDLGLAGADVKGKIVATKPGHKINVLFTKKLLSQVNKNKDIMKTKPLMKILLVHIV